MAVHENVGNRDILKSEVFWRQNMRFKLEWSFDDKLRDIDTFLTKKVIQMLKLEVFYHLDYSCPIPFFSHHVYISIFFGGGGGGGGGGRLLWDLEGMCYTFLHSKPIRRACCYLITLNEL